METTSTLPDKFHASEAAYTLLTYVHQALDSRLIGDQGRLLEYPILHAP